MTTHDRIITFPPSQGHGTRCSGQKGTALLLGGHGGRSWVPVPFQNEEVPGILDVEQLDDCEEIEIRFCRFDMSDAEMAALPED